MTLLTTKIKPIILIAIVIFTNIYVLANLEKFWDYGLVLIILLNVLIFFTKGVFETDSKLEKVFHISGFFLAVIIIVMNVKNLF